MAERRGGEAEGHTFSDAWNLKHRDLMLGFSSIGSDAWILKHRDKSTSKLYFLIFKAKYAIIRTKNMLISNVRLFWWQPYCFI